MSSWLEFSLYSGASCGYIHILFMSVNLSSKQDAIFLSFFPDIDVQLETVVDRPASSWKDVHRKRKRSKSRIDLVLWSEKTMPIWMLVWKSMIEFKQEGNGFHSISSRLPTCEIRATDLLWGPLLSLSEIWLWPQGCSNGITIGFGPSSSRHIPSWKSFSSKQGCYFQLRPLVSWVESGARFLRKLPNNLSNHQTL